MTLAKLRALEALADDKGTTEGERRNARDAAARVRARIELEQSDVGPDWQRLLASFLESAPSRHDGMTPGKDQALRCMASFPSGVRCLRRARVRGVCLKCLRRRAPLWKRKDGARGSGC
jgi:hypothetical protein